MEKELLETTKTEHIETLENQADKLYKSFDSEMPEYLYWHHQEFEMPRFISIEPDENGVHAENGRGKSMDGATRLQLLADAMPIIQSGNKVPFDYLYLQDKLKNPDLEIDNSKIQPRLDVLLKNNTHRITQEEANRMYREAERLIVKDLKENNPAAYNSLSQLEQVMEQMPYLIFKETPIAVQEAMMAKEIAHAFIAIETHVPDGGDNVGCVYFSKFSPLHRDCLLDFSDEAKKNIYSIAIKAQNVVEQTTEMVLGPRIRMAMEAEKQSVMENKKEEVKSILPSDKKEEVKKQRTRSVKVPSRDKAKAKSKDVGMEM